MLAASVEESTLFLIYLDYGNCEESEEISEVVSENFIKYENYTKSLKRFLGGPFSTPLKTHHPVHVSEHVVNTEYMFSVLNSSTIKFNCSKEYGEI